MRSFVDRLEIGDVVKAQVAEVLDAKELIISLNGDLARAANETHRQLKKGDTVKLRVASTNPLALRVVEDERRHGRLDIVT
jgi:hypothetical protein